MVRTAKILERPVVTPAGEVAAAIEPGAGVARKRVGHEPIGRQAGTPQVAAGQSVPSHVNLAHDADRNGLPVAVEQNDSPTRNRHPDRARACRRVEVGRADRPVCHMHRRFGDAIHVDKPRRLVAVAVKPGAERFQLEGFASEDDQAQGKLVGRVDRFISANELAKRRRGLVEDRHALRAQQRMKRVGRAAHPVGNDHEPTAKRKGSPELPHREIKRERVKHRPDIGRAELVPILGRCHQVGDVGVADHHALRPAGRARRINDVRRILGLRPASQIVFALRLALVVQVNDDRAMLGQACVQLRRTEQDGHA